LRFGVAILNEGKRKDALAQAVDGMLREDFRDRILAFDSAAGETDALIGAERRAVGRPISQFAAISRAYGATLATRNPRDFEGCCTDIVNSRHA
jgi:predicted nucleic acid-binding protein